MVVGVLVGVTLGVVVGVGVLVGVIVCVIVGVGVGVGVLVALGVGTGQESIKIILPKPSVCHIVLPGNPPESERYVAKIGVVKLLFKSVSYTHLTLPTNREV